MRTFSPSRCILFAAISLAAASFPPSLHAKEKSSAERPNILWITCEDTSPHLGCYGDTYAKTPNLDRFAQQSVRYDNAFAYTGVCAPSRSCLITGINPVRLGSHHMRSTTRLPAEVKCFSRYLRDAGYYCSNNQKQDYNFVAPPDSWDESSGKAHWRNRQAGQPFFSVFNIVVSHQSHLFGNEESHRKATQRVPAELRHDPARAPIPPFHPDTPEFRSDWAWHYDNLTAMDIQFADRLAELEADGLAEDTIVFFFGDNGTGMPAIKANVWEWGIHVPCIVRFPKKWQHLAPAAPGGSTERLISFVDFAPTMLNLCGIKPPAHMQGEPFLGPKSAAPRKYIYGGRDRMGANHDIIRYVRGERYYYLRNFLPQWPWGRYDQYSQKCASRRAWEALRKEGKLQGMPARFFQSPKPIEELYDMKKDPFQTNNLAASPRHQRELRKLRAECVAWMRDNGDLGLLPEYELWERSKTRTPYEIAKDRRLNPLDELLAAAWIANQLDPAQIPKLEKLLAHKDATLRWWGATGLAALGTKAASAEVPLRKALNDTSPDVRIAAAEALCNLGREREGLAVLRRELKDDNEYVRLAALNVLERMGTRALPALEDIRAAGFSPEKAKASHGAEVVGWMVEHLPNLITN